MNLKQLIVLIVSAISLQALAQPQCSIIDHQVPGDSVPSIAIDPAATHTPQTSEFIFLRHNHKGVDIQVTFSSALAQSGTILAQAGFVKVLASGSSLNVTVQSSHNFTVVCFNK